MSRPFRVAFVGNCQARPLADAMSAVSPGLEVAGIAVVHLLRDAQESECRAVFEQADLIVAQSVAPNYPCRFVTTRALRERYGERVLEWPNLYFAGYNPELFYVRDAHGKPLGGPLGDYHSRTILHAWQQGLLVAQALALHRDPEFNRGRYHGAVEASLAELRRRESVTNVRIVDWLTDRIWTRRLFFTFNHPAWSVIEETARQLVLAGDLPLKEVGTLGSHREPLGQYRPPVNPWIASTYGATFSEPDTVQGTRIDAIAPAGVKRGSACIYSYGDLVSGFFEIYGRVDGPLPKV